MQVTIREVAKAAGVSCATASLALNGKSVNEDTRQRVIQVARNLGYQRNTIAHNLITGKSSTIGMYVLNSPYWTDMTETVSHYHLLRGVLFAIAERGYSLNFEVHSWGDSPEAFLLSKAFSKSIDGMLIMPQFLSGAYSFVNALEERDFPFVMLNPASPIKRFRNVTVDNYTGMFRVLQHLSKSNLRHVAFVNGPREHLDALTREHSFIDNLSRFSMKLFHGMVFNGKFTFEGGYAAACELLKHGRPDAIVCSNDAMAAGVLRALTIWGIRVPDDVSVVGYEDTEYALATYPQLTSVRFSLFDVGRLAATRLLEIINEPEKSVDHLQVLVEPELIIRESCK